MAHLVRSFAAAAMTFLTVLPPAAFAQTETHSAPSVRSDEIHHAGGAYDQCAIYEDATKEVMLVNIDQGGRNPFVLVRIKNKTAQDEVIAGGRKLTGDQEAGLTPITTSRDNSEGVIITIDVDGFNAAAQKSGTIKNAAIHRDVAALDAKAKRICAAATPDPGVGEADLEKVVTKIMGMTRPSRAAWSAESSRSATTPAYR